MTIVLKEGAAAIQGLDGKTITVTGKVIAYKGKPEIEVTDAKQMLISGY